MENIVVQSFQFNEDVNKLLEVFRDEPHFFFLDSSQQHSERGRFSFMGFAPFDVVKGDGKDTFSLLRKKFESFQPLIRNYWFPFSSGMVGYLSYDYGLHQEKIQTRSREGPRLPECCFGFYDTVITIDHFERKLHMISTGLPEKKASLREKKAREEINKIIQKLSDFEQKKPEPRLPENPGHLEFQTNLSKEEYLQAVHKALQYIRDGDIYQVNLSKKFELSLDKYSLDPVKVYKTLRILFPTCFSVYYNAGDFKILSSSPERFLRAKGKDVETRPMKGTCPRAETRWQDLSLREEFINNVKEQAELLMITDLERNDLGKVCDYGSVRMTEKRTIEEYKTVYQATSTIKGHLKQHKDYFDLLEACFPGGSVTGCPKIRAMEIIEELEPSRRGLYTGTFGYINFDGAMEFNILIRTILAFDDRVTFHVGAGIVADSVPENEYEETLLKAKALQECLQTQFPRQFSFPAQNASDLSSG